MMYFLDTLIFLGENSTRI